MHQDMERLLASVKIILPRLVPVCSVKAMMRRCGKSAARGMGLRGTAKARRAAMVSQVKRSEPVSQASAKPG